VQCPDLRHPSHALADAVIGVAVSPVAVAAAERHYASEP
jgi:hypothetical protein